LNPVIIIPAFQPDKNMLKLIGKLLEDPCCRIVVVDDGSGSAYREYFDALEIFDRVDILCHEFNRGKGAALKTAFKHVLRRYPGTSVVTADADGQHLPEDIKKIYAAIQENSEQLALGCRTIKNGKMPLKKRLGNILAILILKIFTGVLLKDTQTGLRGIPGKWLDELVTIKPNGFDYELEVLLTCIANKRYPILEIPINAIYDCGSSNSHFRSFHDSWKIAEIFFKRKYHVKKSSTDSSVA
jgi:dolichol-phosphate mannosyltransferase